jgi:tetratricopeptide (TPR) repeat protein
MRSLRAWLALLPLLLLSASSCALSAPPAETFLGGGSGNADPGESGAGLVALDREAAAALAASKQRPDDADLALRAAAVLFQAADLRQQQGALAVLDAQPDASVGAVLAANDHVAAGLCTEVLSLCTEGLAAADRAAVSRPHDVAVQLHRALHLSLIAWANGPARSLFAGYGGKLVAAIDAAVAADPAFDHAAPLRLQGRFRAQAPWPYGDLPQAKQALARAVELAPIAINLLFLGDALWAAGDRDAARAQWQLASTADGDDATRWSTPLLREVARRRLAALARETAK